MGKNKLARRKNRTKKREYNSKLSDRRKELAIKQNMENLVASIRTNDDPILKEKCETPGTLKTGKSLEEVLLATRNGAGLSAPQIGISERVIAVRALPKLPVEIMVNPEITYFSNDKLISPEGCLSYPGHFVDVERSTKIKVSYTNERGIDIKDREFFGWKARVIQHEIDHLDGICLVKDGIDEARSYSLAEAKERSKTENATPAD